MKFALGLVLVAVAIASTTADVDKCSFGCLDVYEPVCGSNGETYSNSCYLRLASCQSNNAITQTSDGECASLPTSTAPSTKASTDNSTSGGVDCPDACPDEYDPVTDENGVEYPNECSMIAAKCQGSNGNTGDSTFDVERKLVFASEN
ncbi:protease inhibitor Epi10 [Phytophthora megakarya]|uniref:Protease inhibitor Epi10 n=1 Tax=Phytophthora megakarya TaxID=4795 RepID=A0A225UQS4_9STRA|nr:protease inhibitor Epi10 [Phytophthora megakarya]